MSEAAVPSFPSYSCSEHFPKLYYYYYYYYYYYIIAIIVIIINIYSGSIYKYNGSSPYKLKKYK